MLAVDLAHEDRLVAIMDIGTNTELIVGNRHRILAASCPAGPAFEGGAIACGMPGAGRRDRRRRASTTTATFQLGVIGDGAPEGICGSGLVDLLSELLRTGRMNELGRFEDGVERVTLDADRGIYFLESDVNELAQAKGANVAGLQVVFSDYGIQFDDIDVFYLAGGFGRHLKKRRVEAHRADSRIWPTTRSCRSATPRSKARRIALLSRSKRAGAGRAGASASSTAGWKRIPASSISSSRAASSSPSNRPIG